MGQPQGEPRAPQLVGDPGCCWRKGLQGREGIGLVVITLRIDIHSALTTHGLSAECFAYFMLTLALYVRRRYPPPSNEESEAKGARYKDGEAHTQS